MITRRSNLWLLAVTAIAIGFMLAFAAFAELMVSNQAPKGLAWTGLGLMAAGSVLARVYRKRVRAYDLNDPNTWVEGGYRPNR